MSKKMPNPIDRHVGSRVRTQRMLAGLSQGKLGEALGVSSQQVQKYEAGTNRISASRLQQASAALGVSVAFFFKGMPAGAVAAAAGFVDAASATYVVDLSAASEGMQLTKAFVKIKSSGVRRRIIDLTETLAEGQENSEQASNQRG